MVENSILKLSSADKSHMPGFYDPCDEGTDPVLYIKYKYGGIVYPDKFKTHNSTEGLVIP